MHTTPPTRPRVLMLGWEYPPAIAGGLGVATKGLAEALRAHAQVELLLPEQAGQEPDALAPSPAEPVEAYQTYAPPPAAPVSDEVRERAALLRAKAPAGARLYGSSLLDRVHAFAEQAAQQAEKIDFDLIHAHDWMTFPAALKIQEQSGKPVVLQFHSLETDRAADPEVRNPVYELERQAVQQAQAVIAVSDYTREVLLQQYGAHPDKTFTVHNGTERLPGALPLPENMTAPESPQPPQVPAWMGDYRKPNKKKRRVLFLGRVTAQKGPLTFIRTAKRLLADDQRLRFTVAGLGDQLEEMMQLAVDERIDRYIDFRGFVKRKKLQKLLKKTDVLFMPSVSEPFGLVALEAAQMGLPVVMSKQTGVAEVLPGVLMAEYWDSQMFARHLRMLLTYKPLRKGLGMANRLAVESLTWDEAAAQIAKYYASL